MSAHVDNSSIFRKCLAGGIGCGVSGFITNPMDVIKIKNQQYGGEKFGRFSGTAVFIWQEQGVRGFFKGAAASVLREMTYSSLRMGLYEPIKESMVYLTSVSSDHSNSPVIKWSSAFLSGAIGAALFNPIDLVKVRFQSQLPGAAKPYQSLPHAFQSIYVKEGGLAGLYNGTAPTVVRAAFLTCAQLGSYDIIKNNLLVQSFGMGHEDISTHFAAALIASVVTTTAANPADVVKTRVMNEAGTSSMSSYNHALAIYNNYGVGGFMKGWTASYLRIGPHTIISFLLIEKVRQLMGMSTY